MSSATGRDGLDQADSQGHIAIVGGGSIGVAFAIVFARARFQVKLAEPSSTRRADIRKEVIAKLELLGSYGLLDEAAAEISQRVSVHSDTVSAVSGAVLVQECVPEVESVKQELFRQLAEETDEACVLASSSSFMPSATSTKGSGASERALVAHPGNPPFALPVIELVTNSSTLDSVTERAKTLYRAAGMSPVIVNKEVEGFVFNRLQGAVLREAYSLVQDGVASVDDIDTVMRDGLGRRWAFMGPFETVDLNTRGGIAAHAEKMGPSYQRMGLERGDESEWTEHLVAEVEAQRRDILPLQDWESRVAWRDDQLLKLVKMGMSSER